jgi:hypothetical protein
MDPGTTKTGSLGAIATSVLAFLICGNGAASVGVGPRGVPLNVVPVPAFFTVSEAASTSIVLPLTAQEGRLR